MQKKMARGEIEYQSRIIDNQNQGIKDEIVLAIVILPIIVIAYSVFSGTPDAKQKLDLFFEYFNNLPDWYVWLTVGIFGSIYGLKPGLDLFKKK
jgi:Mn2+/Fe2+ NRAMP family transporter